MWHLELPEIKAEVVVVALLTFPTKAKEEYHQQQEQTTERNTTQPKNGSPSHMTFLPWCRASSQSVLYFSRPVHNKYWPQSASLAWELSDLQTHPNLHKPWLSRSNGGHPQREGTNLGVFVPIWLVLPRCEATNLGVFDLCHFAYSNGAVQIRVGLELAE